MGGRMWIWTVMGILVVVVLDVENTLFANDRFAATSARASGRRSTRQSANASWP